VFVGIHQHFFTAGAALIDVDRGPDAAVDQFSVEDDFLVASPFELLEDYFIHTTPRIDQCRGDHRQRASLLHFSGRAKKSLWPLHGIRIHAA